MLSVCLCPDDGVRLLRVEQVGVRSVLVGQIMAVLIWKCCGNFLRVKGVIIHEEI